MQEEPEAVEARPVVLLVDDERSVLMALAGLLSRSGFECVTCRDGAQAVARLGTRRFDAIISDIAMPRLDGIELLHATRRLALGVPVIVLSGSAGNDRAVEALGLGAFAYLTRPVEAEDLIRTVREAVTHSGRQS